MRDELDNLLCERYPEIFAKRHYPINQIELMGGECMYWGFECSDGWFNIIDQLCRQIQSHVNQSRKSRALALTYNRVLQRGLDGDEGGLRWWYGRGPARREEWTNKMVTEALSDPSPWRVSPACPQVVAGQVKEKLGTLRFFVIGGDAVTDGMVQMAEAMSYVTCEVCGGPGKMCGERWVRVLCDEHDANRS